MKKYTDIMETPLRFHTIYSLFILPIEAFVNITSLFMVMQTMAEGVTLGGIGQVALTIVFITLCFASSRGLRHFRRGGLHALWCLLALQIASNVWNGWIFYKAGEVDMVLAIAVSVVIFLSIATYYYQREAIFTKDGDVGFIMEQLDKIREEEKRAQEEKERAEAEEEARRKAEEEAIGEYDCPSCGKHITDGAVFCPRCGAQTRTVRR